MLSVIIVDDEPLALEILETYIERMPEQIKLVGRCNNALEANELLKHHHVDLMFLDIQMPQVTGIDFLKMLHKPPLTVFTTAYSTYAVDGFELNALDYLLKPISFDRFQKAVKKATDHLEHTRKEDEAVHGVPKVEQDFIFVKADKKLVKVKFSEILYVEGLKDYVIIRTETGRVITLQTMKSLEDILPSQQFKRIHRSYIAAIDKIHAIEGSTIEIIEKGVIKELPIGKNYRDELLELIDRNRI
jgi:DNA-binding LytR/AlgR family response regulator